MKEYCDNHIHSFLSLDGCALLIDQVRASREKGVKHLCFTEHIDIELGGQNFLVDFPSYEKQIMEAREAFPDMDIGIGLELGDSKDTRDRVIEQSNVLNLDFKLLSRHSVRNIDPAWVEDFFDKVPGRTRDSAAKDYVLAVMNSVLRFPDWDALAHVGYVFKFTKDRGYGSLIYEDSPDELDIIFRFLIEHGKALEVNTSRFDEYGEPIPGVSLLKRYRELGGELITLGSDSHRTDRVAQNFPEATEQLKELGFRYVTYFMNRKMNHLTL